MENSLTTSGHTPTSRLEQWQLEGSDRWSCLVSADRCSRSIAVGCQHQVPTALLDSRQWAAVCSSPSSVVLELEQVHRAHNNYNLALRGHRQLQATTEHSVNSKRHSLANRNISAATATALRTCHPQCVVEVVEADEIRSG